MSKTYRPFEPDQLLLLPPSLADWLPESHPVFFLRDVLQTIDLTPIMSVYEEEERGYPPYHPKMMVGLLFYGYTHGIFSSRKLARHCVEDVAFRVLTANNQPDFRTISDFRKRHVPELEHLYAEILKLCEAAGIVEYGIIALDGTKFKANASKHKAMSYGRMKTDIKRLKREIEYLLKEAEKTDAREDREFGSDKRGDELPPELARREGRLAKIRAAKWALEEEARQEAAAEEAKNKSKAKAQSREPHSLPPPPPIKEVPRAKVPLEKDPKTGELHIAEKAQRNFTDPDSRIMPYQKTFLQGFNTELAVDSKYQVVVARTFTNAPNDDGQMPPLVSRLPRKPTVLLADAAYSKEEDLAFLESQQDIDAYVACGRDKHHRATPDGLPPPSPRGPLPAGLSRKERMQRKVRTKKGRELYALRKVIAEGAIGQIKQAMGFRSFSMRGEEKCDGELWFVLACHNLRRLFAACRERPARRRVLATS